MTQTELIEQITSRAVAIEPALDSLTIRMDLAACIAGGCDLRLEDMLGASAFDLMHDIYGINAHLDHMTFKLRDCFWPRFAKN